MEQYQGEQRDLIKFSCKKGLRPYVRHHLFILCVICHFGQAYSIDKGHRIEAEVPLISALKDLSDRYQVFFSYNPQLLKDITVSFTYDEDMAFEEAIDQVLDQTNFKYDRIGQKFCVIYEDSRAGRKSARKVERKIKQLSKLELKGKVSLQQHQEDASRRLNTVIKAIADTDDNLMTVKGTVRDPAGSPLPGVNLFPKDNQSLGAITDMDGRFSIQVSERDVLIFSYVGFANREVMVHGQSTIEVVMSEGVTDLNEVVVVGYGKQSKKNLTGAISTITTRDVEARPITSVATALQGTTSGVFINQNSGQPGREHVVIRIRGVGTLNNANPLTLVDGIEAPISNINPSDIESITVLKDASSAAIYGSRAANGVVLITTKRGNRDKKPSFTYDTYYGLSEATRLPEMVTDPVEFANLRNESQENFGNPPFYSASDIAEFKANRALFDVDWLDILFNSAPICQHNLSVGGGTDKTNFRFSLGSLDQEGVVSGSNFDRFNTRLNLDTEINDKVEVGTSISYSLGERNSSSDDLGEASSIITHTIQKAPGVPAYFDGRATTANPLVEIEQNNYKVREEHVLASAYFKYKPFDHLTIKGTAAVNSRSEKLDHFSSSVIAYDWLARENVRTDPLRSALNRHGRKFNYTFWLTTQYERQFGHHSLSILTGYNEEESHIESFEAFRNGHLSNTVQVLGAGLASSATNTGSASTWGLRSYFGRANYGFRDKWLFEINLRYDGSSRFLNDKWGLFPSLSAGWVVSREDFFRNIAVIDFLKIKASWGQLGNQNIGDFAAQRRLSLSEAYNFGGLVVPGVAQTSLGNPTLGWEEASITNLGINLGLLNKVSVEADYFVRSTSGILYDLKISALTGFSTQISNAASIRNNGWEVAINYATKIGEFDFSLRGNLTHVRNIVTAIDPSIEIGDLDKVVNERRLLKRGAPLGAFYGVRHIGIFQSQAEIDAAADHSGLHPNFGPGDLRFEDVNSDGVIDVDDRVILGKENPTWTYGATLRLGYRGFDFAMVLQGAADFDGYGSEELSDPFFNFSGLPARWRDRWTPENTETNIPRLYFSNGPSNSITNSFFVYDRSYFRLKNLQIGYGLSSVMLEKIGFSRARFYVNGSNIFTITKFPFFDPERPTGQDRGADGVPMLRILSAGVSFTF